MSKHKVFLYGTLKKGQPNEYFMGTLKCSFLGNATTKDKYPLIIGGKWNLPMLLNVKTKGKFVQGELHEVDDEDLERLDEFEGHPDFYTRMEIDVVMADGNGATETSWVYFINGHTDNDLDLTHFESYESEGDHGLKYVTSENEEHPDVTEDTPT